MCSRLVTDKSVWIARHICVHAHKRTHALTNTNTYKNTFPLPPPLLPPLPHTHTHKHTHTKTHTPKIREKKEYNKERTSSISFYTQYKKRQFVQDHGMRPVDFGPHKRKSKRCFCKIMLTDLIFSVIFHPVLLIIWVSCDFFPSHFSKKS